MNESANRKIAAFLCAIATIMALAVIATLATGSHSLNKNNLPENGLLPSKTSWVIASPDGFEEPVQAGSTVKASDGKLTIRASFSPAQTGRDVLLFQSEGQCVRVTINGETVYDLDTGPGKLKLNARGYSIVNLPLQHTNARSALPFMALMTKRA